MGSLPVQPPSQAQQQPRDFSLLNSNYDLVSNSGARDATLPARASQPAVSHLQPEPALATVASSRKPVSSAMGRYRSCRTRYELSSTSAAINGSAANIATATCRRFTIGLPRTFRLVFASTGCPAALKIIRRKNSDAAAARCNRRMLRFYLAAQHMEWCAQHSMALSQKRGASATSNQAGRSSNTKATRHTLE